MNYWATQETTNTDLLVYDDNDEDLFHFTCNVHKYTDCPGILLNNTNTWHKVTVVNTSLPHSTKLALVYTAYWLRYKSRAQLHVLSSESGADLLRCALSKTLGSTACVPFITCSQTDHLKPHPHLDQGNSLVHNYFTGEEVTGSDQKFTPVLSLTIDNSPIHYHCTMGYSLSFMAAHSSSRTPAGRVPFIPCWLKQLPQH